jgi:hypothetical protein
MDKDEIALRIEAFDEAKGLTRNNRSTVLDSGLLSFVIGDGYQ